MEILDKNKREELKKQDYEKFADFAHWHRFIGNLIGASGLEIDEEDVPITFTDYKWLKSQVPGWSCCRIRVGSRYWIPNNPGVKRIIALFKEADKKRKYLLKKYPAIKEQEDDLTI